MFTRHFTAEIDDYQNVAHKQIYKFEGLEIYFILHLLIFP